MPSQRKLIDMSEGIYDSSTLSDFERCLRRGYFRWYCGYKAKGGAPALLAGSQVHKCLAAQTLTGDIAYALNILLYDGGEQLWSLAPDDKRYPENLRKIMENYFAHWQEPPDRTVEDCEIDFAFPIAGGFTMAGVIDEVYKENGLYFLREHKTTSTGPTDWFFRRFDFNLQLLTYTTAMKQNYGRCDGIEVNGIRIDKIPVDRKKDGSMYAKDAQKIWFDRKIINAPAHALNTYERQIQSLCSYITLGAQQPNEEMRLETFWQNHNACWDFGGCPYKEICMHGQHHPEFLFDISDANKVRFFEPTSFGHTPKKGLER